MEKTDGKMDFIDEELAETGKTDVLKSGKDDCDAESKRLDTLITAEADRLVGKYGERYSTVAFGALIGLSNDKGLFGDEGKSLMLESERKWGVKYKTRMLEELRKL